VEDYAGHVYTLMTLEDEESYEQVQFSINRDGSVFAFPAGDDSEEELINQYYVYDVYSDIVIEEVNVDPIDDYTVTINGEALAEGSGLTTTQTSNEGEWSKRTYVISKENFQSEGAYNIVVESTDKTGAKAYSDVKNLSMEFVVDQTAPVLTISGLEQGGRYQTDAQTVTVIPTDDGGRLNGMQIIVTDNAGNPIVDDNGNDISVRFAMEGEEFLEYLSANGGAVTFTVPSGYQRQVQIICNDCAVNDQGATNEYNETFSRVTVSQSGFVIFYANKPLFFGAVGGTLVVAGGGAAAPMIIRKRKKVIK
jgi:hypothetical protein